METVLIFTHLYEIHISKESHFVEENFVCCYTKANIYFYLVEKHTHTHTYTYAYKLICSLAHSSARTLMHRQIMKPKILHTKPKCNNKISTDR